MFGWILFWLTIAFLNGLALKDTIYIIKYGNKKQKRKSLGLALISILFLILSVILKLK